jgi:hypothetical protein
LGKESRGRQRLRKNCRREADVGVVGVAVAAAGVAAARVRPARRRETMKKILSPLAKMSILTLSVTTN